MKGILKDEYIGGNSEHVEYAGYSFVEGRFFEYLRERVKPKFDDSEWNEGVITEAIALTGFSDENFVGIFRNKEDANCWRIGELVSECVLEDKYNIRFYYNGSRDAKNLRSNLNGADLVGFCDIESSTCFLFGEVKTSEDEATPPNVMYGKTGMIYQLESLRDDDVKRDTLVKWLFTKAILIKDKFLDECVEALKTYHKSGKKKVQLIGVLVRDTEPNESDLKSRAKSLKASGCTETQVKLLSLYTEEKMEDHKWENAMNRGD